MRWARVLDRFALIQDDLVFPVSGSPFGEYRRTGERIPLADVRLQPPVVPPTFYAVGLNYAAHVAHANATMPDRPEVGYRANSALIGHRAPVVKPADCTGRFEAEAELVAVVGARLRRCSRDEAVAGIFGWTIGNDVSARAWQHSDRTFWRAKNSDTFKPMGPWIETDADPLTASTTVTVDGETVAHFTTGAMIFDPYDYLVEISRYITLVPGDVLWMGTDAVVPLKPGTTLGISITGIGTLQNPIVQEES
ncbi:fumarylacetoacetate hydrolase family protein [Cryptosporangium aurantiacum]|uniref:2-keto-4-pentenoate hydratase/2-oxohepta-3-ene-1,7-dioic acid hydratase (Catechol pathway) n=1 Tax=Cryptosporangium aurantiacum TaxID=134849 RepID=A0A1M7TW53_9ACTN|nr:fumarylacetoacetate hydrolase family protein [Cryptosporangium aurantiacum]SHN74968.1 2-keto-4-pentenoate hydratase/2-oxohepta-3-ene-1,7-dioic acid hydratase (catechol pathway) [Cryptosporangium aurantiacum]